MKKFLAALCAAAASLFVAVPAQAQPWPAKPVHFLVPQAPGGATDIFARTVGQKLSEKWGQPVVVENKPGAAGVVGTDAVAKSAPDGYTFLVTYEGSQAINQSLYAKIPYDSIKDFQPVATLATTAFFLIAGPAFKGESLQDLVKMARAKPGSINYSSSGSGSINHLLAEMLKAEAGIQVTHVPYKAIAAATRDVIGGQVEVAFASVPSVIQHVRAGKLRALAVSSAKRNSAAPDVPTIAELGYPGFDVNPWWGILAPAGTPREIVERVNADVAAVLSAPDVQEIFAKRGADTFVTTPAQFEKILAENVRAWAKVVKSSGARID